MIIYKVVPIGDASKEIINILQEHFQVRDDIDKREERLSRFFALLNDNIYIVIEHKYVDKLYRDSFYHYFSSKRNMGSRDTIRLSFFKKRINVSDFEDSQKVTNLKELFLGFLIIRPIRRMIGRNVLSPKAFKERGFFIRTSSYFITLNGVKLQVDGFPHSSQDAEAMTCAETSIWSLMEYFGTKYQEYSTTLPSKIREKLHIRANQRQLPSIGLPTNDMSYIIKEFGLSTRVYSREAYYSVTKDSYDEYHEILNCYIESGIPTVLILTDKNIGHAVLCIGRKYISDENVKKINPQWVNDLCIYNFHNAERKIIVIDDNVHPYQSTSKETPTKYYDEEHLKNCKLTSFIVPLPHKIYLDAHRVQKYIKTLFRTEETEFIDLKKDRPYYIRVFLTTSNSLKQHVANNFENNKELKTVIMAESLPKFTWVCEIATSETEVNEKKASGLILIDATETDPSGLKPLILFAINNEIIVFSEKVLNFVKISLTLHPFKMFNDNLKQF